MNKVCVIGAGTMGNGIAHVLAQNNIKVILIDMDKKLLDKALETITNNLDRLIKKDLLNDDAKKLTLSNITLETDLSKIPNDTQLIIEAITENKDVKLALFNKLDKLINQDCIFASNTSSISITELSKNCRPNNFIGMHFMNPVPIMKLVEIIRGFSTSQETYQTIKTLTERLKKTPVEVFDYPGFISNRILMPMINEAIFTLYEGVASASDIDTVMKLGMNHPMGPLTLADFIGLDVCLAIMNVLYDGFNDSKYRPCPLLKKMVAAGKLGRKSGSGFFDYTK
ncbi:MAG: 3-hydroxybutyryl-CoA dehydrogenase [Ignavibacteria bacterium]|nr:3-hydroxybutyryl-CoA dehydrogenase [Ignavibacteria bacterium]